MAKLTQSDLVHRWCNRAVTTETGDKHASNLSTTRDGKVLLYDGSVVGVHLTIGGVLITLHADGIDTPRGSRSSPYRIVNEIHRGMPTDQHHAVRISKHIMGYNMQWVDRDDDTATLRNLAARFTAHWGYCGRDDKALARMKARRHRAMVTHQAEVEERAQILARLDTLANGTVVELSTCRTALLASRWTDSEMEIAKVYSDRWEVIDNDRVAKHGAFGHVSWEEQQRRRRQRDAERVAREEKEKEHWTPERIAELIQQWKAGSNSAMPYSSTVPQWVLTQASATTYLRVVGNEVETSRGARIGIRAAARLLQMCDRIWANGVDLLYSYDNPGPQIGPYQLQLIDMDKVVIGCHTLLRTTIEEFRPVFMEHALRLRKMDARENDILADELRPILDTTSGAVSN